jgi:hypothetical protein
MMTIHTKIEFLDYLKLMYKFSYRKISSIVTLFCGILLLISGIYDLITGELQANLPYLNLFLGMAIVFLIPILIYISTKKNYNTHKILKKEVIYEFSEDTMKISGEGFSSEVELSKVFKIWELKDWFIIYQNRQIANFLPKKTMTPDQTKMLRFIFVKQKDIKCDLRRE